MEDGPASKTHLLNSCANTEGSLGFVIMLTLTKLLPAFNKNIEVDYTYHPTFKKKKKRKKYI